jgi:hypothetical protein
MCWIILCAEISFPKSCVEIQNEFLLGRWWQYTVVSHLYMVCLCHVTYPVSTFLMIEGPEEGHFPVRSRQWLCIDGKPE